MIRRCTGPAGRGPPDIAFRTWSIAAMDIVPFVVTYNGMATGPCVGRCVDYLMAHAPRSFGGAIERVEVYAHCQTREPIQASLSSLYERFQGRLTTLPYLRFRRKARLFEVAYASEFLHDKTLFGSDDASLSPADFKALCREFAAALSLIRRRVKPSDDFDLDGLDLHLRRRIETLESERAGGVSRPGDT